MACIEEIRVKIQALREILQNMISSNDNLLTPEIIKVSKRLDAVLNEYEKMLDRQR